MSNRSLIEFNHDLCPQDNDKTLLRWVKCIRNYLTSGNPLTLPYGAKFIAMRHHSEPEFLAAPQTQWMERAARRIAEGFIKGLSLDGIESTPDAQAKVESKVRIMLQEEFLPDPPEERKIS